MIGYFLSMVALIITACVAQQFTPALPSLYDAQILVLPLVFLCCAVTVNSAGMLPLAFLCGFLWDAQHHVGPAGGMHEVYPDPAATLRFGYSIVLYGAMGFFMQGIQPFFREGKWHISALLSGAAIFLYLASEYLLITFVRGDIRINSGVFLKIMITAVLTMLFSPLVFWILFHFARMFRHTIRYDGLRNYNRRTRPPLRSA
jgi:hypothetical protein